MLEKLGHERPMLVGWLMWNRAALVMVSPEVSDFTELSFDLDWRCWDYFMGGAGGGG